MDIRNKTIEGLAEKISAQFPEINAESVAKTAFEYLNEPSGSSDDVMITLPDEDGNFIKINDGNHFFFIGDDFEINETLLYIGTDLEELFSLNEEGMAFATQAAAEKYVDDNKPVVPRGIVQNLLKSCDKLMDACAEYIPDRPDAVTLALSDMLKAAINIKSKRL